MHEVIKSEQAVIGSMIIDPECIDLVRRYIASGDYFKNTFLGEVFDVICKLQDEESKIDLVTVVDKMPKKKGNEIHDFLYEISNCIITTAHVEDYAKIVRDYHARRKLQFLLKYTNPMDVVKFANPEDILTELDSGIKEVESIIQDSDDISTFELVKKCIINVGNLQKNGVNLNITPTGFVDIDSIIIGLERTENIILAARPGMGKTAFALGLGLNVAKQGKTVVFFALEMSKERLMSRLLCIEGGIDSKKIKIGGLTDDEIDRLSDAADLISKLNIYIYDDIFTIQEVRSKIAKLEAREDICLVVIDYIQLIKSNKRFANRQAELGSYAYAIAEIAKKYNTTTLTLSQLSRAIENRQNKRPVLTDLYESGAIEAAADKVLFLYRDEYYDENTKDKGIAEISAAKVRDGETGMCRLAWIGKYFRFANLARGM